MRHGVDDPQPECIEEQCEFRGYQRQHCVGTCIPALLTLLEVSFLSLREPRIISYLEPLHSA